jgi:hypothetical protein
MSDEQQLAKIVSESGLEKSKADVLLASFEDYFKIAGEWERKAHALVVTDDSQKAEMKMAREGRLFLKEKRVSLEKTRKALKEQSLREGKAIDGIANVIKALIVPIEEHLDAQEHFVERREAAKQEAIRLEVEARLKAEEEAMRKWLAAEQEQMKLDNARLREDAEAERKKAADMERQIQQVKDEKRRLEQKAKDDAAAADALLEEAQAKIDKTVSGRQIECPFCHKRFKLEGEQ